jgi:Type I site-specific restriction-modification system, R (restriction) subunit and related helicases
LEEAFRKLTRIDSPALIQRNHAFHRFLVEGIPVEYRARDRIVSDLARLFDLANPDNNDWVVVNQLTVVEGHHNRRPDIVVFVNGIPLGVIELKNPGDEKATIWSAFNQLQTYKEQIPALFTFNELLVISDGYDARIGSLSSNRERFAPGERSKGKRKPVCVPRLRS